MSKENNIPDFTTFQEAREFWEKHSLADFAGELEEAKEVKFVRKGKLFVSLKLSKADARQVKGAERRAGYPG